MAKENSSYEKLAKANAALQSEIAERTKAEAALRASEANLRATLNSIGDAVISTDTEGQITRMNPVAEQLTGWKFAEAQGKELAEIFQIVNAQTKAPAVDLVGKVLESGKIVGLGNHTMLNAKDGAEYQIADSAAPIQEADGAITGVVLVFRDVTEEYRVREEMQESEARFKQIAEATEDVFVLSDVKSWAVLYASPAYEKIWGRSVQELYEGYKDWDAGIHPDDRLRVQEKWARMVEQGGRFEEEYRVVHPDGSIRWVRSEHYPIRDESGQIYRIVGIVQNITERVQAEQALRESEARFKQIADAIEDAFVLSDLKTWNILYASPAFEKIWGRSVQELYDDIRTYSNGYLPADRLRIQESWAQMVEQGGRYDEEYQVKRPDGSIRWVRSQQYPVRDENGQVYRFAGIIQDITQRKQAEQALRESEANLNATLNSIGDAVIATDNGGQITRMNPVAEQLTGWKFAEAQGKEMTEIFQIVNAQTKAPAVDPVRKVLESGKIVGLGNHTMLIAKDGSEYQIADSAAPIQEADGVITGVVLVFRDVTEEYRVREELQESEARFKQLANGVEDVFVISDVKSASILYASPAYEKIWGRPVQELYKDYKDWNAGIHPEDRQRIQEVWERMAEQGGIFDDEYRVIRPDGSMSWVRDRSYSIRDENGQVYRVVGIAQDITERVQAENYLSNIINSMPSVLVGVDADGKITMWNSEAQRSTGLLPEQAVGQPLAGAFPRLASEMERVREAMQMREVRSDLRKARKEKGETRYEDVTVFPLIANGVEGAVIRVDDVTNQMRIEEMMIQSEKMLSVGGLAAGMAHEINNPLAGMMQTADNMSNRLTDMDLPANLRAAEEAGTSMDAIHTFMESRGILRMLTTINESGRRLAEIVDNMLSFARKSDTVISSRDVPELLDKALELAATDYNLKKQYDFKAIEIVKEYADNLPYVACEGSKLQQVFLNILRNGAQAMYEAGTGKPTFVLRARYEKKSKMVYIEIEDNGPGMDEATRKRAFEPFFTTKPVGEGTGLGLSVSYFIITENHAGEMSVESTLGEGANFIIQLPIERTRSKP